MLGLLLGRQWSLLNSFFQFLDQSRYRVVNKDQWCNVLEFSRAVDADLKNYDVDGACNWNIFFLSNDQNINTSYWVTGPVMLDEFVEWLKVNRGETNNQ